MMEKQTKIGTVPKGWEVKKLKEVFHINELSLPSNTDANYKFKYIPIEFVTTNHIDYENCEAFRFVDAPGRARRIVRENDILVSGVRPNLKSFAVFKKPDDSNWICSTGFYVLTAKDESDNLFSYYELLSEIGESQFYSYVAGSNYPAIGDGDIRNMKLMFPKDKSEQSAIAAILSKVDEAIAAVQASISAAERLKKSLMQNLLTGRMKPDGTLRTEEEFYLEEKFGKVPVGWEVKRLGYLFNIKAGGDLQEDYYSPIKDSTHAYPVFSNSLDNNGLYGYTSNPRFHAKESVTITGRGGVGHPEYRRGDYDAIIRLISLIPLQPDTIDCKYICYYIGHYVHFALESTGVPQLTCPKVFSTKIMIPIDVKEQNKIGEIIHHFDAYITEKQNKIAILERLKKSLMQNLLTGRVRMTKKMIIDDNQ